MRRRLLVQVRSWLGMPVAMPGRPDLAHPAITLAGVRADPSLTHPHWPHGHVRVRCYWCGRRGKNCSGYPYKPEVCYVRTVPPVSG